MQIIPLLFDTVDWLIGRPSIQCENLIPAGSSLEDLVWSNLKKTENSSSGGGGSNGGRGRGSSSSGDGGGGGGGDGSSSSDGGRSK